MGALLQDHGPGPQSQPREAPPAPLSTAWSIQRRVRELNPQTSCEVPGLANQYRAPMPDGLSKSLTETFQTLTESSLR